MNNNPFLRPAKNYVRDLDIIDNYVQNMGTYLSISTGQPLEDTIKWIKSNIKPKDPKLKLLARENGGDRHKKIQGLSKYLAEAEHTGRLLGPNLIMYENPDKKKSFISDFIEKGLIKRSVVKKKGQVAEMEGDMDTAIYCDNQQGRIKILNNSISGAHANPHNPIYNSTAHTTLTSVCGCATSYSNALTEKLLMGNRHYYSVELALADMASIIRVTDLELLTKAMNKYGIVPPSVEYVQKQILSCCNKYWRSDKGIKQINAFIANMNPIQLSAVSYVSDLKAIRDNNDKFMRDLFSTLVEKPTEPVDNPEKYHKDASSDLIAMVGLVMSEELNGRTVKKMMAEDPEYYKLYGAAIKQIMDSLKKYSLFIEAFLRTDNMPPGIQSITSSLRESVIVSDTDSTIFSTESWVIWYIGENKFNRLSMSVAGATAFIDSQNLAHILALLSKHLGVKDDNLFRLAMKTEFYQPVMGVTNMAKHYFSYIQACEGNVYSTLKFDTKGVNLKNSRTPKIIINMLNDYIKWVMDSVMKGVKPELHELLKVPVLLANEITEALGRGEYKHLTYAQIKPKSSYSGENPPALMHYELWESVFAPVYGPSDPPPYQAIKVPVDLEKRSQLEAWAKTIEPAMQDALRKIVTKNPNYCVSQGVVDLKHGDIVLHDRALAPDAVCGPQGKLYKYTGQTATVDLKSIDWAKLPSNSVWKYNGSTRDGFTNLMLPSSRLRAHGIPKEIAKVIDIATVEDQMLSGFFVVLECCGYYFKNSSITRRLSQEVDVSIYK